MHSVCIVFNCVIEPVHSWDRHWNDSLQPVFVCYCAQQNTLSSNNFIKFLVGNTQLHREKMHRKKHTLNQHTHTENTQIIFFFWFLFSLEYTKKLIKFKLKTFFFEKSCFDSSFLFWQQINWLKLFKFIGNSIYFLVFVLHTHTDL